MLEYLGEREAASRIINSIEKTLLEQKSRTKDLNGESSTIECSDKILDNL